MRKPGPIDVVGTPLSGGESVGRFVIDATRPFGDTRIDTLSAENRETITFDVDGPHSLDRNDIGVTFDPVEQLIVLHFGDAGTVAFPDISNGVLADHHLNTVDDINGYTRRLADYDVVTFL